MGVLFEHGSEDKPKGHALLYFRNSSAAEDIWASWLCYFWCFVWGYFYGSIPSHTQSYSRLGYMGLEYFGRFIRVLGYGVVDADLLPAKSSRSRRRELSFA